jgi:hypothetical protein
MNSDPGSDGLLTSSVFFFSISLHASNVSFLDLRDGTDTTEGAAGEAATDEEEAESDEEFAAVEFIATNEEASLSSGASKSSAAKTVELAAAGRGK